MSETQSTEDAAALQPEVGALEPPSGSTGAAPAPAASSLVRRVLWVSMLGVLLYGVLVVSRGADQIGREFRSFQGWAFAGACGLSLLNYGLRFIKWEYYLRALAIHPPGGRALPIGESLMVFLSGFVLTVTPGKVGEVFKSVVLRDLRGVSVARTAPIVVAERLTDLVGVIALIAVGSSVFAGGIWWASVGAAVVAGLLLFVASPFLQRPALALLRALPGPLGRFGTKAAPIIETALHDLKQLTSPRRLLWPSLLSIAGWALEGVGVFVILRGFGSALGLGHAMFSYATATLAGALVPVPGGLGVTEKVLEESMVHLGGVPGPVATAAMLLGRLSTLWFAVLVGFVALAILKVKYPKLLRSASTDR